MASASGALSRTLLLLLLLLLMASTSPRESLSHAASQPMVAMKPVSALKSVVLNETLLLLRRRRRLNSFRICALCTCCGGPKGLCLPSPCCYAINCNIPNRPFGFCSFTPKTCNCFGCHL
ncbi:uncharacterized protein LOC103721928 [Phoenix dactylifera]|uniref:Uncharacterized protein LOC103721928 n=1 Tax=Phoenix dactylifera TaxID=42345 RepID=A0A8B9AK17_PHODC|nr:uncharacterized protein LOC103721928 [Phoenix dactylifera]